MADPLLIEQAPALVFALAQSLRLTFQALGEMYDGKAGPWVDELKDATVKAVLSANKKVPMSDLQKIDRLFRELRKNLRSVDPNFAKPGS